MPRGKGRAFAWHGVFPSLPLFWEGVCLPLAGSGEATGRGQGRDAGMQPAEGARWVPGGSLWRP